jgi:hypothetical protein
LGIWETTKKYHGVEKFLGEELHVFSVYTPVNQLFNKGGTSVYWFKNTGRGVSNLELVAGAGGFDFQFTKYWFYIEDLKDNGAPIPKSELVQPECEPLDVGGLFRLGETNPNSEDVDIMKILKQKEEEIESIFSF